MKMLFSGKLLFSLMISMAVVSCTKVDELEYDDLQQDALDLYMEAYNAALLEADPDARIAYRQSDGYYIQSINLEENIDDVSSLDKATNETTYDDDGDEIGMWVRYNIESSSLQGDVCKTRTAYIAERQGTYNYVTHYAPIKQYVPLDNYYDDALDCAFRSTTLTVNGEVRNLYAGDKFKIYMPSKYLGYYPNGEGGYAGQFTLSTLQCMVSEVEIVQVISDVQTDEEQQLYAFITKNGGMDVWIDTENNDEDYEDDEDSTGPIYVNKTSTPSESFNFDYSGNEEYSYYKLKYYGVPFTISSVNELDQLIYPAMLEDFDDDHDIELWDYENDYLLLEDDDEITTEDYIYIWYIVRFLDGFILDSNIDAVREYAFGEEYNSGTTIYYQGDNYMSDYIMAWYYAIPGLKYGQWASFITTSTDAYGYYGQSGDSSTTEIPPYTPLLFSIYIEASTDDD